MLGVMQPASAEVVAESAGSILQRTFAQSVMRALGRRKGKRLLREWAEQIADEENIRALFPRPGTPHPAEVRKAAAWLAAVTPALIAALPPE